MDKHLHIVSFDVPYPPDYGGATDVFYRIKALYELGVKIHLHCFEYGRGRQPELNKYCVEVNYYKRSVGWKGFSFSLPYIVKSRANQHLLQNLLMDDYPILLEGIHCSYFLYTGQLKNRKVFIRLHNVEFDYYNQLAEKESSFFKKLYFKNESRLLKNYEKVIGDRATILAITPEDAGTYKKDIGAAGIKYLPAFPAHQFVTSKEGKGEFCLYHGNLSVIENEEAALWLSENVFSELNIPFVIAGKKPSEKLKRIAAKNKNVSVISDPSTEEMDELVGDAQINVLPSLSSTGIKIKLLNALFTGRHCLANKSIVNGTGTESLCHVAETSDQFISTIKDLIDQPVTANEIEKREQILNEKFNNRNNAELLMQWIY